MLLPHIYCKYNKSRLNQFLPAQVQNQLNATLMLMMSMTSDITKIHMLEMQMTERPRTWVSENKSIWISSELSQHLCHHKMGDQLLGLVKVYKHPPSLPSYSNSIDLTNACLLSCLPAFGAQHNSSKCKCLKKKLRTTEKYVFKCKLSVLIAMKSYNDI